MIVARSARAESVELHTGDRMTREEFHRIYEQAPEGLRAELIGGTVYVTSPLRRTHGTYHVTQTTVLGVYEGRTPGVEAGDNATILLGDLGEPQPDLYLRILPECVGQSRTTPQEYVEGAPEMVVEIAHSSRAIDLFAKRDDYARYGVLEYVVLALAERTLFWLDLRGDRELAIDGDGILRARVFPGLWIDAEGVLARDHARLMAALERGLATAEHADLVRRLAAARQPSP